MTERVLDVIAEHPEEDHVAGEMPEIGVQESVGDERQAGDGEEVHGAGRCPVEEHRHQPEGYRGGILRFIEKGPGFEKEVNADVGGDDRP